MPYSRNSLSLSTFLTATTLLFLLSGCAPFLGQPKTDYIEAKTGMEFMFIKGGSYQMGNAFDDSRKRESPLHTVTVTDFAVGRHEVTFDQYDQFCNATGRPKPADEGWGRGNRPVINVSWEDASAFSEWLNSETGLNFSLPSESQWEYFARAGTTTLYWTGNKLPKRAANCKDCGSKWDNRMTAPAGSFRPNPWGIYDTAGNAAEWVLDDFQRGYDGAPVDGSAWFIEGKRDKAYRGGSWQYPKEELGSATRDSLRKDIKINTVGFRLVLNNFILQQEE